MSKIHIITVSTNSKFYFPYLKESCKRNGKEMIVLGYGEQWKGLGWKFNLMKEELNNLEENDIVCFVDGYDVICIRNLDELKDDFIKIQRKKKCKIIVGYDNYTFSLHKTLASRYFGCYNDKLINSGTYIGYVKDIKQILSEIIINNSENDQLLLTQYFNKNPKFFYIDKKSKFFAVVHKPLHNIDNYFQIKKNNVFYKENRPYFVHAPACTKLNNLLMKLNYSLNKEQINTIDNDLKNYIITKFILYSKNYIYFLIILFIILIIYFVFQKKKMLNERLDKNFNT